MQTYQNRTHETFKQTLQKGVQGENAFINYCKSKNIPLLDVRLDKQYQRLDVDFVDNNLIRYEVKSESSYGKYPAKMQRFYIEDVSCQSINSDGWFRYCQADVIANYDATNLILYMFKLDDLKQYIDTFHEVDKGKVDYCKLKYGSCGFLIYIQPFLKWLNDNGKYNQIIDNSDRRQGNK